MTEWGIAAVTAAGAVVLAVGIGRLLVRDYRANQRMDQLIRTLTVKEDITIEQAILLALTPSREGVRLGEAVAAPFPELSGLTLFKAVQAIRPRTSLAGLYLALGTLEQKGLITSRWGDEPIPDRQGARRRYYRRVV